MEKHELALINRLVLIERIYLFIANANRDGIVRLRALESAMLSGTQDVQQIADLYNYIFLIIDHICRFQKVALRLPKEVSKSKEYKECMRALSVFYSTRNNFQHIDEKIDNEWSGPLLGAICWVSDGRHFLISFNDVNRVRSSPTLILDAREGIFTRTFAYVCNDTYYDIGDAIERIETFMNFFQKTIHFSRDEREINIRDDYLAVTLDFKITLKTGGGPEFLGDI